MNQATDGSRSSIFSFLLLYLPLIVVFGAIAGVIGYMSAKRDVPIYEANSTVLFRFGLEYMPTNPAFESWRGDPIRLLNDDAVLTEIQVLGSRRVLEATLATLATKVSNPPAIEEAGRVLSIRRIQGTNVARVSYRSPDPELAKGLVHELIASYFQVRTHLLERPAGETLSTLANDLQSQWIEAEERLALHQRDAELNEASALEGAGGDLSTDWAIQQQLLEAEVQSARQLYEDAARLANRNRLAEQVQSTIGPTIEVLDEASLAPQPVGLGVPQKTAVSAGLGMAAGLLVALLFGFRRTA
jgi:uncharacterized protein involved in exopolysaccharide biosynthesis